MNDESIFEEFVSVLDSIPDQEDSSLISGAGTDEEEQGSDEDAVTPVDSSAVYTVVVDQGEVVKELQRIEGVDTFILYTLFIGIGLFLTVVLLKMFWYFSRGW